FRKVTCACPCSDIGLALCERLLAEDFSLQLCPARRSLRQAVAACSDLLTPHPTGTTTIFFINKNSHKSFEKKIYNQLDHLCLSAGIMPNPHTLSPCSVLLLGVAMHKVITTLATGEGVLMQKDGITPDGMQEIFTTSLFGHFLLVSHLTLSTHSSAFSLENLQHQRHPAHTAPLKRPCKNMC
uniref:Uncharacterized protein n=1 Tax=Myripristis murdjan TaxID=586833 RepID=A0A667XFX0_9TELE